MSPINVLVAAVTPDVQAEGFANAVAARLDMHLLEGRSVLASEVGALLQSVPRTPPCALIVVGRPADTNDYAERWLAERADIVVMHVSVIGDIVRLGVRRPGLESLLTALRELVERVGTSEGTQAARFHLYSVDRPETEDEAPPPQPPAERPLLQAAIHWIHELLRHAVTSVPDENGDMHGLSVTRETLLQALDATAGETPRLLSDASATLDAALVSADSYADPLAIVFRALELTQLEFRLMVLGLAPELDLRFQRCIGFLLDDIGRRAGTMALYAALLGVTPRGRGEIGALARWRVFEDDPAADEPLRLDPFLAQWLLGNSSALTSDPRVRRVLRIAPWSGAALLGRHEEQTRAAVLLGKLEKPLWLLLGGDDAAGWRALLERGAQNRSIEPIRAALTRFGSMNVIEIEDCAVRLGRLTRLTSAPLVIDAAGADDGDAEDEWVRLLLAVLSGTKCGLAVISSDVPRFIKLLDRTASYEAFGEPPLPASARVAAVRAAAAAAEAYASEEVAEAITRRYPLGIDGLEDAMRLAATRPKDYEEQDPALARFIAAAREIAAEGISHLAQRIEPVFSLDDVVLPADRTEQLHEIVDHVRLAPQVLDEWKFAEQLPYGRGVTALFFGPSGTGKTMAALGIARSLGVQLLRLDFSRVVSKYIGDTEKNIDRVFTDAQRSGSAILIDEADALLGKRSEVKDAHDRYANIEVAYLLQRMEEYAGLAILTTNLRQNLDPAFLRRLRFMVDFPRPNAEARQQIWRFCLPDGSHLLEEPAFAVLARKIDVTGGQIRQITVRAAFLAAAAGVRIGLEHIVQAARAELAKLGLPPVEIDLAQARRAA